MSEVEAVNAPKFANKTEMVSYVRNSFEGRVPAQNLDYLVEAVESAAETKFPTSGSVAGFAIWVRLNLDCQGYHFTGDAFGLATAGGGPCWGDLYTDNLQRCLRDTRSFSVNVTPVTVLATFHADDSTLLGTFIGGGVMAPALAFTGGGKGGWTRG